MGASAGKVTLDEGESTGISTSKAGNVSDDDEDLMWDYGDEGGGGILEGNIPQYQQTVERIRILEQVRQNLAHQRHQRLNPRQLSETNLLSGAVATGGGTVISAIPQISDLLEVPSNTPIVTPTLTSPVLSIVLPTSLVPASSTSIVSNVPIGSSLQSILSLISTPPPSPVETSTGTTILPTATISSSALTETTPPPSRNTGSTNTGPSTTITSYLTSLTSRSNGTALSNTRTTVFTTTLTPSTTTVDGTVIIFTYPTDASDLSSTGNSSRQSSTSSSNSSASITNSTTSTISSTFSTPLWISPTDVDGGAGGGYVAPTSDTSTASLPTSTGGSSGDSSPPVSPSLLGGVLGGVAGLAFVLVAILYLLRRHRLEVAAQQRDEAGYGGPLETGDADQMTQRSSVTPFAFGGFFGRHSRQSRVSNVSETPTTAPSTEVGFYKVSGRMLPPVLGGPRPGYGSTRSAGGSSVYPDDDGITVASTPSVAGPSRYSSITATSASPTISSAPMCFVTPSSTPIPGAHPHAGSSMAPPPPRIQEEAAESDNESAHRLPRPPPLPRQLSAISVGSVGKDGVGRSLPSHDGSRASRFTEDIL